ncbi:lysine--tRNA ligase [Candidatus Nomurabacteria bacterium RIFOXYC2_FULL_36_19]|uniref:Lysine--tRNA ligase n=3 Tax=Candidatus Nomuraibacteriota TaxID=1752729 RepID=A0A1F6YW32_9BACT|nr:MAG: Lysine-tRNA ligase [Candidatus Nomurabacteria bacterium GW2011_GWC2_35_8]OGJ05497.1 MAG: lysine--tRNA ligase [Candidatus Nomurabacteria bacterium RIFOXYA2_FULL_35_9]OGJ06504.1 MAG: lysine--tRNA ligase [Candidatus Nomurabacteria bacterium RIFOXYA1_FULL_35_17]OGJ10582.1 MAG: lysine--tRNA ligase [Candidatus Nomurabacteria bacterium RIFOXYC2_FULL_36_19]OGJ15112.1 MAG: lysine--tRNA ligase [Candidatus Nomurabacteria bacterium RIFOXYD2_FULL_35_12]
MYWADSISEKAKTLYKEKIKAGIPLVIRDEKTLSGRVHVGSLRGLAIHGIVEEFLKDQKIPCKYFFEFNDFDPMDGLPVYLDQEKFLPHMGKPLCDVPSPDGKAKNYAEYFGDEFAGVISELGFVPEYYRSSTLYRSGKYNSVIKTALLNADKIRAIYKKVSNSQKEDSWLPLSVICEKCGKVGTTRASLFDGEMVSYECGDFVKWAKGCGYKGKISPFDGKAKLPWKVEWAAKFSVMNVDIEGGGKDHSTKGGAREIADAISREVFKREPPMNIPYEFFNVGGKKMSSSKGAGSSSREVADLLPPHILRLLLIQKDPKRVIEFIPDGDTVPILFDTYDKFAQDYFADVKDDFTRLFPFVHLPKERKDMTKRILPRFSEIAFLVQMPHVDIEKQIEKEEGTVLKEADIKELEMRKKYAEKWLSTYAPEDYKFEIQKELPELVKGLSVEQKGALSQVLAFLEAEKNLDGQILHTKLHEIKTTLNIEPKKLFSAIYISILGKESGPKAGWFLSVLPKDFLIKRFKEVVK